MTEVTIAPLWRRFAAMLYDSFILLAISFGYGALLTLVMAKIRSAPMGDYQPMFNHPAFFLGWVLTLCFFYGWFWWRCGQTVGMKAWRLQLVGSEPSNPLNVKQIFIRLAAGIPSVALLGAGYWYQWFNKDKACLHDRVSQTVVVVLPKKKN